jgi:hypothetical protein
MRCGRRKLYNDELHKLCPSPNMTRMMKPRRVRWVGNIARMEVERNACRVLVVKPEGKRQ